MVSYKLDRMKEKGLIERYDIRSILADDEIMHCDIYIVFNFNYKKYGIIIERINPEELLVEDNNLENIIKDEIVRVVMKI